MSGFICSKYGSVRFFADNVDYGVPKYSWRCEFTWSYNNKYKSIITCVKILGAPIGDGFAYARVFCSDWVDREFKTAFAEKYPGHEEMIKIVLGGQWKVNQYWNMLRGWVAKQSVDVMQAFRVRPIW